MRTIQRWLLAKWDWWVYCCATHSFRRLAQTHGGFTYLMELYLRQWNAANPISPALKMATEAFHESCNQYVSLVDTDPKGQANS